MKVSYATVIDKVETKKDLKSVDIDRNYTLYIDGTIYTHSHKKWLKPVLDSRGYLSYNLRLYDGRKTKRMHRLVAEYFISNPLEKGYVNHIDGNKLNNHTDNLEWCTVQENIAHAYKNGLMNPGRTMGAKNKKQGACDGA